ncbi:hypothetical protein HCN44_000439 [Aphidius gifuensis]|uniref:Uncharacterized protein n=1 Tax=Aphidius gifuensis TaxID=684658 RepID=A0A835CPH4_APHGI|nr:hypothetical protein HCN44_000439 [Aphidius gifuensis]
MMLQRQRRHALTLQDHWEIIVNTITELLGAGEIFKNIYQLHQEPQQAPYVSCMTCNTNLTLITATNIRRHHLGPAHRNRVDAIDVDIQDQFQSWNRIYHALDEDQRNQYSFEIYGQRGMIKCQRCWTRISTITLKDVQRHHVTVKHQKSLWINQQTAEPERQSWESCSSRQNAYWYELCQAFARSGIPFEKLQHVEIRTFLEKWVKVPMPEVSTIRKSYLNLFHYQVITMIRQIIGYNTIQIFVDETIDAIGRKIAILMVMPLLVDRFVKPMIIWMDNLTAADGLNITNFIERGLEELWPQGIELVNMLPIEYPGDLVTRAQRAFRVPGLQDDIERISQDYQCITEAIVNLEIQDLTLTRAVEIMRETSEQLLNSPRVPEIR